MYTTETETQKDFLVPCKPLVLSQLRIITWGKEDANRTLTFQKYINDKKMDLQYWNSFILGNVCWIQIKLITACINNPKILLVCWQSLYVASRF